MSFIFSFDSSDSNYAGQVTSNLPVINTSGSFTTLTSSVTTSGSTTTVTVTYEFTTITGEDGLSFNYVKDYFNDARISNLQITNFDNIPLSNSGSQFRLNYLTSVTTSSSPTILTGTSATNMFNSCNQLTTLNLSNWDTSGITDMSRLFYNCQTIASINVSNWNPSNVTTMNDMFFTCPVLVTITGLSGWNVANVTNMSNMFTQCYLLSSLSDVSGWNVSKVTNMSNMFSVLSAITSLNLSSWNVSNVLAMDGMFNGSSHLTSIGNVSSWNVSKLNSMNSMFTNCGITSINVSNWNVSNVTGGMNDLFSGCSGLTSLDLTNWNVTNVAYMRGMFAYCANLTTVGNLYDYWNVTLAVANDQYSDFTTASPHLTGKSIPNWANPPTSPPSPPTGNVCFPAGTPVTTDQGIVPIQNIIPDFHTIRKLPILAITRTALKDDYMVCFEKDSILKNVPSERTIISPQHTLFYKGRMIEARFFPSIFDGVTVIPYSGEPVYNVLMVDHSKMIVNNIIVETLDPENTVAELYRYYKNPTKKDQNEYIHIQESSMRTMMELKEKVSRIKV